MITDTVTVDARPKWAKRITKLTTAVGAALQARSRARKSGPDSLKEEDAVIAAATGTPHKLLDGPQNVCLPQFCSRAVLFFKRPITWM